ncbi:MAG: imidazole glycerol phosphate synthase subunit HisH [Bacteroidales bacterium]
MKIAIIKYNAGNIRSVFFALSRLGVEPLVTSDPDQIRKADKVIFPGVGEASTTMISLKETGLDQVIGELRQPVLGICLGLQLMCSSSEEGNTTGLGIFNEQVKKFPLRKADGNLLKVPHIGWNTIDHLKGPLFKGLPDPAFVYFVHSYYAVVSDHIIAQSSYGVDFSAALQKDNFFATQFHPEKSGRMGELILQNFIAL